MPTWMHMSKSWLWLVPMGVAVLAVSAFADTAANEQAAEEKLPPDLQVLNDACKSDVKVVMDWPSFRAGLRKLNPDYQTVEGKPQRIAVMRCSGGLDGIRRLCEGHKAGPVVAALKTIKCSLNAGGITGVTKDGTFNLQYGWDSDMDNAERALLNVLSAGGKTLGESEEIPKIDVKVESDVDDINAGCKTTGITAAIDWKSFQGNYNGWASGPTRIADIWNDFHTGIIRSCHKGDANERKKFYPRVKSLSIMYDATLAKGELVYEIDVNGRLRMRINTSETPSNIEEKFDKFVGVQTQRPIDVNTPDAWMSCGGNRGDGKKTCKVCSNDPADIAAHGGKVVADKTFKGGKKRVGDCWVEIRWLDGTAVQ